MLLILLFIYFVETHQVYHVVIVVLVVVCRQLRIVCGFFVLLGQIIFFIFELVFDALIFGLLVRLSMQYRSCSLSCPL